MTNTLKLNLIDIIKPIIISLLIMILAILTINTYKTTAYCTDTSHMNKHIENPVCSKCGKHDGIVVHKCSNPDGKDLYCTVCGKLIKK